MTTVACEHCGVVGEPEGKCQACGAPMVGAMPPGLLMIEGITVEQFEEAKRKWIRRRDDMPFPSLLVIESGTDAI